MGLCVCLFKVILEGYSVMCSVNMGMHVPDSRNSSFFVNSVPPFSLFSLSGILIISTLEFLNESLFF